jgi:hypothetical protein
MKGSSCITEVFTESAGVALADPAAGVDCGSSPPNGMSTLVDSFDSFPGSLTVGAGSDAEEAVLTLGSAGEGAIAGGTAPGAVDPSAAS